MGKVDESLCPLNIQYVQLIWSHKILLYIIFEDCSWLTICPIIVHECAYNTADYMIGFITELT